MPPPQPLLNVLVISVLILVRTKYSKFHSPENKTMFIHPFQTCHTLCHYVAQIHTKI